MKHRAVFSIALALLMLTCSVLAQRPAQRIPKPKVVPQSSSKAQNDSKNTQWLSPACTRLRSFFEGWGLETKGVIAELYSSYTRQKALDARQRILSARDWDSQLPCCPENLRIANESPFFEVDNWFEKWAEKEFLLGCYHPGAESNIRTSIFFHKVSQQTAGQQCTYDKNAILIPPENAGAGTPDFVSPTVSQDQHLVFDVFPWTKLTRAESDSTWTPDVGCQRPRTFEIDSTVITNVWLYVKRGDVISISATGRIKFDVEGNETGPEGSLVIPKTDMGILGRLIAPNPLSTAKPGALLGGVYTGELESPGQIIIIEEANPFYAGKAGDYRMPATGYLVFAVNDGYPQNNSGTFRVTLYRKLAR